MDVIKILTNAYLAHFVARGILRKFFVRVEFKEQFFLLTTELIGYQTQLFKQARWWQKSLFYLQVCFLAPWFYTYRFMKMNKNLRVFSFLVKRLHHKNQTQSAPGDIDLLGMYHFAKKASCWNEMSFYPAKKTAVKMMRSLPYLNPKPIWYKKN